MTCLTTQCTSTFHRVQNLNVEIFRVTYTYNYTTSLKQMCRIGVVTNNVLTTPGLIVCEHSTDCDFSSISRDFDTNTTHTFATLVHKTIAPNNYA